MKVVILVPRKVDGGQRDGLWAYCKDWWQRTAPDWQIVEGHTPEGEAFCRSREVNEAARLAGAWDVCLVVDGDIFLEDINQARQAVQLANNTGRLCFAHDWRFALGREMTAAWIDGQVNEERKATILSLPRQKGIEPQYASVLEAEYGSYGPTWSSCQAYRRDLWEEMGGFDERFRQWGCEDWAAWCAPNALRGGHDRVNGAVFHFFHERAGEDKHEFYEQNLALGKHYMAERNNPANTRAIIGAWKEERDRKASQSS